MTKEEIKQIVSEAIQEALTIEVTYEKRRDEKTGMPLATPELKKEKEYLPIWWIRYLPHYEASNRGIQETQDKQSNTILKLTEELKDLKQGMAAIANIMIQAEKSIKILSEKAVEVKQIKQEDILTIENNDI